MRPCAPMRPGVGALGVIDAAGTRGAIVYTVTYVEVVPPSTGQGAALLHQYREATRREEGALRIEVLQRIGRLNQFVLAAAWASQQALDVHEATAPTPDLRARLEPLLASPNDERRHTGLAIRAAPVAPAAGALYAVTHVDVVPARKDDGLALLVQLAGDSGGDAGNVRFDVIQQTNRPNHFTVVEVWTDQKAFEAHGMAAHTRRFREQLAPMSGALYDERLYRALP